MSDPSPIPNEGVVHEPPREAIGAAAHGAMLSFGGFRLDCARRLLTRDGEPVRIGSRALDLLIALTNRAGDVIGRHELLDLVWHGVVVDEAGVRVHMASLRKVLGDGKDGARFIVNVAGRGYSFVAPITLESVATPPVGPPPPKVPLTGRAPMRPRPLIGREEVVDSLGELLLARRFISIVGSGGIGKTSVAVAIADKLRPVFGDDHLAFVDLGAISDERLITGAVISAVGCAIGGANPVAELITFLCDKRMLIVLDSCEHLVDSTALLAEQLFRRAPSIHLLVTSRESLRVDGETVHLLSPLTYPANAFPSAAEALATPAVQLFISCASFAGFQGDLTDADAPVVADICRRTDGIALAIELAASRVGAYGIRGVANLLATSSDLRLIGQRNVAPRHRTLEAALDWSFRLLAEHEQRMLARLSVFVGLFTMEAAGSVASEEGGDRHEVAATLSGLVDRSFVWVQIEDEVVFYRLPDMTRAYASAKLDQLEDIKPIACRHAEYFAALFGAIALEHGAYADIRKHALHLGNVRKALEWSFSTEGQPAIGIELAAGAAPLFLGLWLLDECRHWSRIALNAIETTPAPPHRQVRLLEGLAVSTMHTRGNTQEVRDAIESGLTLSDDEGGELTQLRLLAGLNLFLTRLGDFEGGLAAAKRCGSIAERSGSLTDRIIAEWMLAAAHHLAGNQVAAIDHCERGFTLEAEIGRLNVNLFGYDHHLRAELALARALGLRGAPERAGRLARTAIADAALSHLPGDYSMAAGNGIPVLIWSGDTGESGELIDRLISHTEKHSLTSHNAAARALKGEWLLLAGDSAAAVEMLQQALGMLHQAQLRMIIPGAFRALASALGCCGRHGEARALIDHTLSSAIDMGQKYFLPELLRTQAEILLASPAPDIDAAEQGLRKSILLAREQGAKAWELKAAIPLARLLIEQGRASEAHALIAPIYDSQPEKDSSIYLSEAASILAIAR